MRSLSVARPKLPTDVHYVMNSACVAPAMEPRESTSARTTSLHEATHMRQVIRNDGGIWHDQASNRKMSCARSTRFARRAARRHQPPCGSSSAPAATRRFRSTCARSACASPNGIGARHEGCERRLFRGKRGSGRVRRRTARARAVRVASGSARSCRVAVRVARCMRERLSRWCSRGAGPARSAFFRRGSRATHERKRCCFRRHGNARRLSDIPLAVPSKSGRARLRTIAVKRAASV